MGSKAADDGTASKASRRGPSRRKTDGTNREQKKAKDQVIAERLAEILEVLKEMNAKLSTTWLIPGMPVQPFPTYEPCIIPTPPWVQPEWYASPDIFIEPVKHPDVDHGLGIMLDRATGTLKIRRTGEGSDEG